MQPKSLALAVAAACVCLSEQSPAQEIEEIIVTANRRSQPIQEVPYNLSVISGEQLQLNRTYDFSALSRNIAGITYLDQGNVARGNNNNFIVRGLNANSAVNGANIPNLSSAVVSTYIGETPVFFPVTLKDIERIEVLRGPQGTLYGASAAGGTIRIIPSKPDTENSFWKITTDVSITENSDELSYGVDVVGNLALSDAFAVRVSAGYLDEGGWIDQNGLVTRDGGDDLATFTPSVSADPFSGFVTSPTNKNSNDLQDWYVRATAAWSVTDDSNILLAYYHEDKKQDNPNYINPDYIGGRFDISDVNIPGASFANVAGVPGGLFPNGATTFPANDEDDSGAYIDLPFEREFDMVNLDADIDFGFATLTSTSSYYNSQAEWFIDPTGFLVVPSSPGAVPPASLYGFFPRFVAVTPNISEDRGFVQEIRLVSNWDKPFDFVIGGFYQDIKSDFDSRQSVPGLNQHAINLLGFPGPNPQNDEIFTIDSSVEFEDFAVFTELTYHITDRWQITGGARVFWQEIELENMFTFPFCSSLCAQDLTDTLGSNIIQTDEHFQDEVFKFNTSYEVNDNAVVYFTWAEGFRRGGANRTPTGGFFASLPEFASYQPDKATNYEVGIKGSLWNKINYSFAGYYINWDNFQFDDFSPGGLQYVVNGEDAETHGVELSLSGYLTDRLSFNFGYTYTHAEVTESFQIEDLPFGGLFDPFTTLPFPVGQAPTVAQIQVFDGDPLPGVPEHSLVLSLDYTQQLQHKNWVLNYHIDGSYRSSVVSTFNATSQFGRQFFDIDGFSMWNAAVDLNAVNWRVGVYVKNIFDEQGLTGGIPETAFTSKQEFFYTARPRTVGLSFSYDYN